MTPLIISQKITLIKVNVCTCAEERPGLMSSAARRDTFSLHRNWTRRDKLLLDCVTALQQEVGEKNTAARLFLGKTHLQNCLFLSAKHCSYSNPSNQPVGGTAAIYTAFLLELRFYLSYLLTGLLLFPFHCVVLASIFVSWFFRSVSFLVPHDSVLQSHRR